MSSARDRHLVALCAAILLSSCATVSPSAGPTWSASSSADAALAERVRDALHDNRYVYDRHIDVSAEHGRVILRGFVLTQVDLIEALRIARRAAKPQAVTDELTILLVGQR